MPAFENEALTDRLTALVQEAMDIRSEIPQPSEEIDPSEYLTLAHRHRQATDSLEGIYGRVMLLRWHAVARRGAAADMLEDAEVGLSVSFDEYASAKEKDLKIKTLTIDARRIWRAADRDVTDAMEAERFVRLIFQGSEAARRDLDARLRAISFATSFER